MAQPPPAAPTIFVDGRELAYEPGETVIQVALRHRIDVPHYCYHPGLSIAGNCRICMVEVEGSPRPQIACKMSATPGLRVRTTSEIARMGQAGTMQMLLVNHPLDCPICDQAGECRLQDYAYEIGEGQAVATTPKTHLPKNEPFGSGIVYDAERCIKCTLCVRFCDEVAQTHELAMAARGDQEIVIMTRRGEFETRYSMNIVDLCPVGALTSRDFRFKSRLWFMDFVPSLCTGCARGCNVVVGTRGGEVLRLEPRENGDVNRWWMCDPGRLGYGYANSETRLSMPALRGPGGGWKSATWDQAVDTAAECLRQAKRPLEVVLDGSCTLEEMWLLRELASRLGGRARYAARTGQDGDDFLIVNEKGANARGAQALGLERIEAEESAAATLVVVEREGNVPASLRSGALVAFATDARHVPESARVAFPHGSFADRDGYLVNCDGIVQEQRRSVQAGPISLQPLASVLEEILLAVDGDYQVQGPAGLRETLKADPALATLRWSAVAAEATAEATA